MFGYLTVYKPELKFKEFEVYKAVYCSLCKNLKKNYGLFSSFALNYECTFLALLGMGLEEACPHFEKCRCTFNPLKKCNRCVGGDVSLDFASAVTVILSYYKLLDAIEDNGLLKKLTLYPLKPFLKRKFKKASKKYPEVEEIAANYAQNQSEIEKTNCGDIDKAANPTANMLSSIFYLLNGDKEELSRLGYCLGRWIYLMDAYDDIIDDAKKGNYNVFLSGFAGKNMDELNDYAYGVLNFTLGETIDAFEEIKIYRFNPIFLNIVRDGMTQAQDSAKEKVRKNNEKSV